MRVVSDTSPISNLAIIGRLELLKRRYGVVHLPSAVAQELSALSHPGAQSAIASAFAEGWLLEASAPVSTSKLPFPLDPGEKEAIALALSIHADVLLMDEKKGRQAARQLGLQVGGLLGELLHAKQNGFVADLRKELTELRTQAGFLIDSEIERFILSQAGE